jgi:hypothetical protein
MEFTIIENYNKPAHIKQVKHHIDNDWKIASSGQYTLICDKSMNEVYWTHMIKKEGKDEICVTNGGFF